MVMSPVASIPLPPLSPLVTNLSDLPTSSPGDVIFERPLYYAPSGQLVIQW